MNRKLILSLIFFLVIAYINEWFAVNQPDPGAAPKLTKYKGVKDELHETFDEIPSLYPNLLLFNQIESSLFVFTENKYSPVHHEIKSIKCIALHAKPHKPPVFLTLKGPCS